MLQESFLVLILSANVLYELCGMFVLTIKYPPTHTKHAPWLGKSGVIINLPPTTLSISTLLTCGGMGELYFIFWMR